MTITCATYNILHGRYREMILANLLSLLEQGVDVFCLQETGHEFEKDILEFLQHQKLGHWQAVYAHEGAGGHVGILWNTEKLTLLETHTIHLPSLGRPSGMQLIRGNTDTYQRVALLCSFSHKGTTLNVVSTHLAWEGGFLHRFKQITALRKAFDKHKADYDIVCGDFNTMGPRIAGHVQKKRAEKIFGSDFTNVLPDLKWSFDTSFTDPNDTWNVAGHFKRVGVKFRSRLDYIFCRNLVVTAAAMHDLPGSDHRPLVATFSSDVPEKSPTLIS